MAHNATQKTHTIHNPLDRISFELWLFTSSVPHIAPAPRLKRVQYMDQGITGRHILPLFSIILHFENCA